MGNHQQSALALPSGVSRIEPQCLQLCVLYVFGKLTRCNHDFMLLGSDAQEGQVILGVNVADRAARLGRQLVEQASVLHCCGIIQRGPYRNTLRLKTPKQELA